MPKCLFHQLGWKTISTGRKVWGSSDICSLWLVLHPSAQTRFRVPDNFCRVRTHRNCCHAIVYLMMALQSVKGPKNAAIIQTLNSWCRQFLLVPRINESPSRRTNRRDIINRFWMGEDNSALDLFDRWASSHHVGHSGRECLGHLACHPLPLLIGLLFFQSNPYVALGFESLVEPFSITPTHSPAPILDRKEPDPFCARQSHPHHRRVLVANQ